MNAVLDLARSPEGNYGIDWTGHPPTNFSLPGTLAAATVLSLAADLAPADVHSSTYALSYASSVRSPLILSRGSTAIPIPNGPAATPSPLAAQRISIGTIVGVVVAGVGVLLGVIFFILLFCRRRKRFAIKLSSSMAQCSTSESQVEPFWEAMARTASSSRRRMNTGPNPKLDQMARGDDHVIPEQLSNLENAAPQIERERPDSGIQSSQPPPD